ncbi:hypothetical protein [Streptomyces sp. NPDC001315]|uniref:hypothetical protein n=1 Tax=Streptomyces sp. NPDC001315 TaxID=3364562 RepID=UPI0036B61805
MKLGKALATGVAEERPEVRPDVRPEEEELELSGEVQEVRAAAPEEVPAVR